ncbi:TPA: hypothetical protein DEG21_03520 [Patescibacteria group bacterium]|nr:hypothetical protein [Candidatus Gracilibacteria bacterium]HBY74924.1 hypothetical protein [Candidatus Gracilibacteria bacterium]
MELIFKSFCKLLNANFAPASSFINIHFPSNKNLNLLTALSLEIIEFNFFISISIFSSVASFLSEDR